MPGASHEFDLIAHIRGRASTREDVLLGIGDDAAILRVPAGRDLIVSTDTLNAGVHFPVGTAPFDIGWKSLAVNLSDLAAMGAEPAWCTLNLSLPDAELAWLDGFLDGFLALAAKHRVALVGGDTTRGPMSISVTVHGFAAPGSSLRRSGAKAGDDVWVSGTLGDAAAGLALAAGLSPTSPARDRWLVARLDRPEPRVALGIALAGTASACVDVSDGLLADLGHVLVASGVGGTIESDALPMSREIIDAFAQGPRMAMQLGGGDDYELCFTAAPSRAADVVVAAAGVGVAVTRIGSIEARPGLRLRDDAGLTSDAPAIGYRHFDNADSNAATP